MSASFAQRLSSGFIALCDRYVHTDWRNDENMLFRARFLVGILIAYQFIMVISVTWVVFLPMPLLGKLASIVLQTGAVGTFYWLMRNLRRSGRLRLAAELTIAATFFVIQVGIISSGGPQASPSVGIVVVPAVVAICLVGGRHGLYWGISIFALQMALILAGALGVDFPNLIAPDQVAIQRIFTWVVTFSALIGIVLVYGTLRSHLKRDRLERHLRHEYLASHDLLTGLANRKQLIERLEAILLRMQRKNDVAAIVYLDLDGFKRVNDTLGHAAGDKILQVVAQRLQSVARKHDVLARIGGDEFAVLMEDIGSSANAEQAVLRFQQAVAEPIPEYPDFPIRGSFGIAMTPAVSLEAMTLLQVADQAMYLAKKQRQVVVTVNAPFASSELQAHQVQVDVQAIAGDELQADNVAVAGSTPRRKGLLGWVKRIFLDHCDRILSPQLRADPDQLIRGRTLIGMARFIQLATVFVIVNLWFIAASAIAPSAIDYVVMLGIAIFGATLSALIAFLHRTANLAMSINILLFIAFVVVQFSTLLNGGIAKSPAMDSVALPVLMAFCLSGRRLGLIWAALTVVFHIGVAIVISHGVDVALVHRPQLVQEFVGGWGVGFVATLLLIHVFESINVRMQQERDREYAELEFLATHDALTGLVNRRQFHDALTLALERLRTTHESLAVIYLDLDGFKPVNDTLGHAVGDIVLQTVARRIDKNARSIDTVARLGGDEFGILLQGVRSVEDAAQIASKIRYDIARPIGGLEMFPVSGSIGIAMAPQHSDDGDTLVRMADQAMFRAKVLKNSVTVYQ